MATFALSRRPVIRPALALATTGGDEDAHRPEDSGTYPWMPHIERHDGGDAFPSIGARLLGDGRYELLACIGVGAMGSVHLARHRALDRLVAVKLLRRELLACADAEARFRVEARTGSRLRHDNTVQVIDGGHDAVHGDYLVMNYVDGTTLFDVLDANRSLPPQRAVAIGAQILASLGEAHAQGIVHRDIKPANIMLVSDTDDDDRVCDKVKVLDFGIATLADADGRLDPGPRVPATDVVGTPEYMSPEQAQGLQVDARSDLYAVGVLLYDMLTGSIPFLTPSPRETLLAQLNDEPIALRTRAPHVSEELAAVIAKAMSKRPEDRHPSARAFRSALLAAATTTGIAPVEAAAPAAPSVAPIASPIRRSGGGAAWIAACFVAFTFTSWCTEDHAPAAADDLTPLAAVVPSRARALFVSARIPFPFVPRLDPSTRAEGVMAPAPRSPDAPFTGISPTRPVVFTPPLVPDRPRGAPAARPARSPMGASPRPIEAPREAPSSCSMCDGDVTIGALSVHGLPRPVVQRALSGVRPALERCYRVAVTAAGRDAVVGAQVQIGIDVDGLAHGVGVGALPLPGLSACATAALSRVRTHQRPDTGTVIATFFMSFTPRTR